MENNYIEIIREILGEKLFVALSEELFNKINSKYPRIRIDKATKIVEYNMATILIIGIERANGCEDKDLVQRVTWYNVCSQKDLLERNVVEMEKAYSNYIEIIINAAKEIKNKECND